MSGTSRLFRGFLLTLVMLLLCACSATLGPKLDGQVQRKPDKSQQVAKVARHKIPSKITESKKTVKIASSGKSSNQEVHGFGIYYPWVKNLEMGRMLMPKQGALTSDSGFDLIIHFHGGDAVRKRIADTARGVFVVGIDLGAGSGAYGRPFSQPETFLNLLAAIEKGVAEYTHNDQAHIRHLGLTGWSAGYGAIRAILRQKASSKVDAVVLLDGLHANYDEDGPAGLRAEQLKPFVRFARRAAKGDGFMFVSHSKIIPPGYASTTETTHYLAHKLDAAIHKSQAKDSPDLARYEQAKIGNFLMQGYQGDGKDDHCAQLDLITGVVAALEKRWKTPLAQGRRYASPKPMPLDEENEKPSVAQDSAPRPRQAQPAEAIATAMPRSG
jgi:hypothetical protein